MDYKNKQLNEQSWLIVHSVIKNVKGSIENLLWRAYNVLNTAQIDAMGREAFCIFFIAAYEQAQ